MCLSLLVQQYDIAFLYVEKRITSISFIKDVFIYNEDPLFNYKCQLTQKGHFKRFEYRGLIEQLSIQMDSSFDP